MRPMSVEEALNRDLRRLRRAAALFMMFLLLLPWFFRYVPLSYPSWRLPRLAPAELPEARPVPETYPLPVQWIPAPMEVFERWIKERYPDSLVGLEELVIVNEVARRWNINPGILISIIGAEHSFLSPRVVGWEHALKYYENPFSYGVYKGSPLPFAIGWEASASGAASIISRIIQTMPQGEWTAGQYAEFWRRLSGYYVRGDMNEVAPVWLRNVVSISAGLWGAVQANPQLWARALLDAIPAAQLAEFGQKVLQTGRALGDAALQLGVRGAEKVSEWLNALQTALTNVAGERTAERIMNVVVMPMVLVIGVIMATALVVATVIPGVPPL